MAAQSWIVVSAAGIILAAVAGAVEIEKPAGPLSKLKVGQSVTLTHDQGGFTISMLGPEQPLSHKVIEVGPEYVVLEDVARLTETTIPIHAMQQIVLVRLKANQEQ